MQRKPHAGGRCASLAAVGNWQAAQRGNRFTVNVYDQALHGADYYRSVSPSRVSTPPPETGLGQPRRGDSGGPCRPGEPKIDVNADGTPHHVHDLAGQPPGSVVLLLQRCDLLRAVSAARGQSPVFARSAENGEISRHLAGSRVKELSLIDEIDPEKRPAHARDCMRP